MSNKYDIDDLPVPDIKDAELIDAAEVEVPNEDVLAMSGLKETPVHREYATKTAAEIIKSTTTPKPPATPDTPPVAEDAQAVAHDTPPPPPPPAAESPVKSFFTGGFDEPELPANAFNMQPKRPYNRTMTFNEQADNNDGMEGMGQDLEDDAEAQEMDFSSHDMGTGTGLSPGTESKVKNTISDIISHYGLDRIYPWAMKKASLITAADVLYDQDLPSELKIKLLQEIATHNKKIEPSCYIPKDYKTDFEEALKETLEGANVNVEVPPVGRLLLASGVIAWHTKETHAHNTQERQVLQYKIKNIVDGYKQKQERQNTDMATAADDKRRRAERIIKLQEEEERKGK